jgi:hypothetical protein
MHVKDDWNRRNASLCTPAMQRAGDAHHFAAPRPQLAPRDSQSGRCRAYLIRTAPGLRASSEVRIGFVGRLARSMLLPSFTTSDSF